MRFAFVIAPTNGLVASAFYTYYNQILYFYNGSEKVYV